MSDKIFDRPDSPQPVAPKVKKEKVILDDGTKVKFDKEVEPAIKMEIVEEEEPPKKEKKPKKPRKPMDEETKARLLEQLARGRETSRLNRKKRAEAKKIIKKQKDENIDEIIKQDLERKKKENQDKDFLREELTELKNSLKQLMEENKQLRSNKSEAKVEQVKEEIKHVKEEIKVQAKGESVPTGQPINANIPVAKPLRVSTSRGIKSRWDKYKN